MVTSARIRMLLLALMVAASHVALAGHVAAHFQPALEHCELCVSQAQPLAAIPVAEFELYAQLASATVISSAAVRPIRVSAAHPWFQRAPPLTSS
jgi:disulfide bond formation protein DsbB